MTLKAKLDAFKADFEAGKPPYNVPYSVIETMHRATAELRASGLADGALKVGDRAPAFTLSDADGNPVSSAELLKQGPLVVSFYRGVWCPYCNLDLQALQAELPQMKALGANLVAISPQTASNSRKSMRQNDLSFPVLNDAGNEVAAAFGIRYQMPDYLIELYKSLKNDLPGFNGDDSWTLPLPGRFVIDTDGTILYAEVDPDYTNRPETELLLPSLTRFAVPKAADVSAANQAIFEQLKKGLGMVPNLYATLAYSETALGNYLTLQNGKSSLNAKEREVINLVVSQVNECAYCLAAHTALGGMVGFTPEQIIEIRKGGAAFDGKLDALAKLVKSATLNRGHAEPALLAAFLAAGYSKGQLVDTVMVIGDKIITNYLHALTQVPVDFPPAPAL
ncbi:redoxin domain-containing protein [Pseudoduganella sp. FT25W]|uniref:Redoxin domain-containing protein n=2 Tax=Duganella alba TaxID=2666081 RepID=A0A6L5QGT2_9BURK|nr:redoxin domain-containing protein [Duganella alba]MRX18807.1 redoxin domain-containing protein [Duganella alba]